MINFTAKLSLDEKAAFTKRLAFLINANVPIIESLQIIKRQMRSGSMSKIFSQIVADVSNGQYLSTSLLRYRRIFGDFAINLIKIGEEGGVLHKNLGYLSEEFRKRYEIKKKVIGSLIYPIFVITSTIGIIGIIAAFVFPKVSPIFYSLGADLPITTRILIASSNFILNYWHYIIASVFLSVFTAMLAYKKIKLFNYVVSRISFSIPIIGKLLKNYQLANFSRTMGLLINCNVDIVSVAKITAEATTNSVYKREIYKLAEELTSGRKIFQHLEKSPALFPDMIHQTISVSEVTGNLGDAFLYLASYYESEVDDLTKNLSNSLEPILLLVMGLIVGFVAVAVISPIYEITKNIHA